MKAMTDTNIIKRLLSYALPMILGNLFQLTYNAADSIIIGKFAGENAVAAVSAANPIMSVIILGVSGICIGASVLMSEFYGAENEHLLKQEISTLITAGTIFSFVILILGLIFSKQALILLNVPNRILDIAATYLRIIFTGLLFTFLYNAVSSVLRSMGDAKTPVRFLILSSILNVMLDILFIGGLNWGVAGAAGATVISQGISVLLCVLHIYRNIPALALKRPEWSVNKLLLKKTLHYGLVTALQQSCQPIGKALIQGCINTQGISMIAAFNAVNRVDDFACIPEQSISHGMMTYTAQNKGAGNNKKVREILKKGLLLELGYWILICAVTLLLKTPIMKLFAPKGSAEMIEIGVSYLTIMSFFYLFPAMTNGLQGFFRGIGNMTLTLSATLIQISLRVIFVYFLVPRIGINGAALACMLGWAAMLLFEVPYYFRYRKNAI